MGWQSDKNTKKQLIKRHSTVSDQYVSDSEANKFKSRKNSFNSLYSTPTKLKSGEVFTPYSKIPAIGEKIGNFKNINNQFTINYHSDTDVNRHGAGNSKIPIYRSQSVNKNMLMKNSNIELKRSHLLRRNTYVVLEPIVCVQEEESIKRPATKHSLNVTYTKLKSEVNEKSIVFGAKLFNNFDSDSDMCTGDEMSPSSSEKEVKKGETNLNKLNYLLRNLKMSRNTESDLLLPKNNPWLL